MFSVPDRLTALMDRIERGDLVTQRDVDKVSTLIALDLAQLGMEMAKDTGRRLDESATQLLGGDI